jgi:UrcA family protein
MKTLALLAATAPLVLLNPLTVHAARRYEAHSTVVRFGDLDLNHSAGLRKLYERIRRAARMVCSGRDPSYMDSPSTHATSLAEYRGCVEQAIDSAVKGIGLPTLTAYADLQARIHCHARAPCQ